MLDRRGLFRAAAAIASLLLTTRTSSGQGPSEEAVFFDKEAPVLGNPKGDVTIVEYFDYQCFHCRHLHPMLKKVVEHDGKVRLIMKDWPLLGEVSVFAAQAVLGAARIGKYETAMNAVIHMHTRPTHSGIREALENAGLSMAEIATAMSRNSKEINDLLDRNYAQAVAFGFKGTPAFVIGKTTYPGVLDEKMLLAAIADARA